MIRLLPLLFRNKLMLLLKLRQMEQFIFDSTAKVFHQISLANVPPVLHSSRVNLRLARVDFICHTCCFLVVCLKVSEGLEFRKLSMYWINRSQESAGQLVPKLLASVVLR